MGDGFTGARLCGEFLAFSTGVTGLWLVVSRALGSDLTARERKRESDNGGRGMRETEREGKVRKGKGEGTERDGEGRDGEGGGRDREGGEGTEREGEWTDREEEGTEKYGGWRANTLSVLERKDRKRSREGERGREVDGEKDKVEEG